MTDETQETETESFEISVVTVTEVDFPPREQEAILEQTGAESVEEAIEAVVESREMKDIQPAEKLIGMEVTASGPSDD